MKRRIKLALPLLLLGVLALVGYSTAAGDKSSAKDTLVFGASADPALMDPALTSDGESLRPAAQIFDSLITTVVDAQTPAGRDTAHQRLIEIARGVITPFFHRSR